MVVSHIGKSQIEKEKIIKSRERIKRIKNR
jgi:CRISPR/Cas system-associated protein Cas7 (RAMP superfamily)